MSNDERRDMKNTAVQNTSTTRKLTDQGLLFTVVFPLHISGRIIMTSNKIKGTQLSQKAVVQLA